MIEEFKFSFATFEPDRLNQQIFLNAKKCYIVMKTPEEFRYDLFSDNSKKDEEHEWNNNVTGIEKVKNWLAESNKKPIVISYSNFKNYYDEIINGEKNMHSDFDLDEYDYKERYTDFFSKIHPKKRNISKKEKDIGRKEISNFSPINKVNQYLSADELADFIIRFKDTSVFFFFLNFF